MVTPDRTQRIAEIVEEALERDAADWPSFLDESCGDDPSLRKEVESLLAYQKEATDFIEAPAYQNHADFLATEGGELKPGDLLGAGQPTERQRPVLQSTAQASHHAVVASAHRAV